MFMGRFQLVPPLSPMTLPPGSPEIPIKFPNTISETKYLTTTIAETTFAKAKLAKAKSAKAKLAKAKFAKCTFA